MDNTPVGFTNLYDPLATAGYVFDPSTNSYVPVDPSQTRGVPGSGQTTPLTNIPGTSLPVPPDVQAAFDTLSRFVGFDVQHSPIGDALAGAANVAGNAPGPPNPGSLIQSLVDQIPGASTIEALLKAVYNIPTYINQMINTVEGAHPINWITSLMAHVGDVQHVLDISGVAQATRSLGQENLAGDARAAAGHISWDWLTQHTIGTFFSGMLEAGLGVDISKFDEDAMRGVTTTDNMLGFTFVLQYIVAIADHVGAALFANRWPESITETIAKIPEEMGLSWALGLVIDESFKTAVGRSLEEGINKQKRGNRIEWPQIRIALKQHILEQFMLDSKGTIVPNPAGANEANGKAVYEELLKNQGFPDWTIEVLDKLADAQLPVGDLQQMYLREIMTGDDVKAYLTQLGFNAADADRLYTMYIAKAETESSATLRSTARALFTNNLIDETRYRAILTEVSYPEMLIADDIEAINLLHETGRVQTSLTSIKSQYQHHSITPAVATQLLKQLNYTDQAIANLFTTWDLPPLLRQHHISQAKVLSYLISGLLTPTDAQTRLIAMGMDPDDAAFLVAHPSASGGVRQHGLTVGMITQAYAEGIIDYGKLPDLYTKAGIKADALQTYLDQAYWKRSHYKLSPDHKNTLTDGDIRAAFKNGLMHQDTATNLLVANGWSADDALLLLEITNKGPITTPPATVFSTPDQAIAFLESYGWSVLPPVDPLFNEAEVVAQTAGYSVQPPPGWDPYNAVPIIPVGGGTPPPPTPQPLPQPPGSTQPPGPVPNPGI